MNSVKTKARDVCLRERHSSWPPRSITSRINGLPLLTQPRDTESVHTYSWDRAKAHFLSTKRVSIIVPLMLVGKLVRAVRSIYLFIDIMACCGELEAPRSAQDLERSRALARGLSPSPPGENRVGHCPTNYRSVIMSKTYQGINV